MHRNETTERNITDPEANLALLGAVRLGDLRLRNRMVMAPMTRSRAAPGGVPRPSTALYYAQRASAGLIISEGVCIAPEAVGAIGLPGIWNDEHVSAWQGVTNAVHQRGGQMLLQLWHMGRASHPAIQPGGQDPIGPSAVAIDGQVFIEGGWVPCSTPRALAVSEIAGVVSQYAHAAQNALRAGFDGVEIHGANGYLPDQFLQARSNRRTDAYGGCIENRARFLFDVVDAVVTVCGAGRVGLRISPSSDYNDMGDPDPAGVFAHVLQRLDTSGLAYIHVVEPGISGADTVVAGPIALDSGWVRARWSGGLIVAGEYDSRTGEAAVSAGLADAVAFGRLFLANPDLPERFATSSPLNEPQRPTFYGGGDEGYIDYPSLEAARFREQIALGLLSPTSVEPLSCDTTPDQWAFAWAVRETARLTPIDAPA